MGSTGSGAFSDYPSKKPQQSNEKTGGSSEIDKCSIAFSTRLDEVGRCDYYINNSDVPPFLSSIKVIFNGSRMTVVTLAGLEIGYLPTRFNYLRFCLNDGFSYGGIVSSSNIKPTPSVFVDITPI